MLKDLSQVYIPGPQYTKSTGYKSNQTVTPLRQMQVRGSIVSMRARGWWRTELA